MFCVECFIFHALSEELKLILPNTLLNKLLAEINISPVKKPIPKISHFKTLQNLCIMRYKKQ